jgi:hypothetical protein
MMCLPQVKNPLVYNLPLFDGLSLKLLQRALESVSTTLPKMKSESPRRRVGEERRVELFSGLGEGPLWRLTGWSEVTTLSVLSVLLNRETKVAKEGMRSRSCVKSFQKILRRFSKRQFSVSPCLNAPPTKEKCRAWDF